MTRLLLAVIGAAATLGTIQACDGSGHGVVYQDEVEGQVVLVGTNGSFAIRGRCQGTGAGGEDDHDQFAAVTTDSAELFVKLEVDDVSFTADVNLYTRVTLGGDTHLVPVFNGNLPQGDDSIEGSALVGSSYCMLIVSCDEDADFGYTGRFGFR